MKARRTVALPRPKGTRATSRVALTITMHPRRLEQIEQRAAAASMSLTAYVDALLESDGEDVAPRRDPKVNWLEDNSGATVARRCELGVAERLSDARTRCVLAAGHKGTCSSTGPLSSYCAHCDQPTGAKHLPSCAFVVLGAVPEDVVVGRDRPGGLAVLRRRVG